MSKKITKRSLALGALMAFVITGSAMAGETLTIDKYNVLFYKDNGYNKTQAIDKAWEDFKNATPNSG